MGQQAAGLVNVIVQDAGNTPIGVYKIVQRATGMTSTRARQLVNAAPQVVIRGVTRVQADALKIEIEALGATVELAPADVPSD